MKKIDSKNINFEEIASELANGGVIVYPTETCYGLGADAKNTKAVQKIFEIKKRPHNKSVIVLMKDMEMVLNYVNKTQILLDLASKYWPGPLTIVVKAKENNGLAPGVQNEDGTIAVRISSHQFVQRLFEYFSFPLVSTSANFSNQDPFYSATGLVENFKNETFKPDIIIDSGELDYHSPSTIVKINNTDELSIIRQGDIHINT